MLYQSKNFRNAERIIITLHGYGFDSSDFIDIIMESYGTEIDNAVFLFPDAPLECEQSYGGRKWFDLGGETSYDEIRLGLDIAAPRLFSDVIENAVEEYSVPFENIDIIGFSQGAMLAFDMIYYANFSHIIPYSGIFVPRTENTPFLNNKVLIVHGSDDLVVSYDYMDISSKKLTLMGIENKTWTCNEVGHSISYEGLLKGIDFLRYD